MKDFLKTLVASLMALALFFGTGAFLLIGGLTVLSSSSQTSPKKVVLVFDLDTNIPDSERDPGPGEALQRALRGRITDGTALPTLVRALDHAARDPNVAALFLTGNLRPEGYGSGYGALRELKAALQRFREKSGKPVIAYNQGWGRREYFLCSGAGTLYGNPFGQMEITGPSIETMFLAGAFRKYGIEFQVTRVGKYKSAVEPFVLDRMSDENRAQLAKLLGDLWTDWKASVAEDRGRTPEDLQRLADEKGVLTASEAQSEGLVDKLAYYDEVLDELKKLAGKSPKDPELPQMDLAEYAGTVPAGTGKNRIAVVYVEGPIVDGEGEGGVAGGETLSRELRELRLNPQVKAIVLRVNSPGGSAAASEVIQRETILAKAAKPVVVSMGTVAASGGYWISAYGSRILAEPETITGSIGVFGLLPNVRKLAGDHGITWDEVRTSRLAMPSLSRPSSPEELARIQGVVDEIYDQFLRKVAEGRRLRKEDVHEIAQGRVWSGREALKLGLVDELGGLEDAVRIAAELANVGGDFRMDVPTPPPSPLERVLKTLARKGGRRMIRAAGPAEELKAAFERQFQWLETLDDPRSVYARLPFDAIVR